MKNMMKKYEAPQMEAVYINTEDVCAINNSGEGKGIEIDFGEL